MHTYCLSCYWRGDGAGDTVYSKLSKVKVPWLKRKLMVICGNTCVQWHACCILVLPIYKAIINEKVSCLTENHETKAYWSILTISTIFSFCTVTIGRLFLPPGPALSYKPLTSV